MMQRCEGCGTSMRAYELDSCIECGAQLCEACMRDGCCGNQPAVSAHELDEPSERREAL